MNAHSKSIAAVVGALASLLVVFNVDISSELQAAIVTVVTAISVYFAPANQP